MRANGTNPDRGPPGDIHTLLKSAESPTTRRVWPGRVVKGCIPESPGFEMQPGHRLAGTCLGAGTTRTQTSSPPQPGGSARTHTGQQPWREAVAPMGAAPLLPPPGIRGRGRKHSSVGPSFLSAASSAAQRVLQVMGARGSACLLLQTSAPCCPALTPPLVMLWHLLMQPFYFKNKAHTDNNINHNTHSRNYHAVRGYCVLSR